MGCDDKVVEPGREELSGINQIPQQSLHRELQGRDNQGRDGHRASRIHLQCAACDWCTKHDASARHRFDDCIGIWAHSTRKNKSSPRGGRKYETMISQFISSANCGDVDNKLAASCGKLYRC